MAFYDKPIGDPLPDPWGERFKGAVDRIERRPCSVAHVEIDPFQHGPVNGLVRGEMFRIKVAVCDPRRAVPVEARHQVADVTDIRFRHTLLDKPRVKHIRNYSPFDDRCRPKHAIIFWFTGHVRHAAEGSSLRIGMLI